MLAHLVAFGGEHHAVAVFYRQPQLQGVDGIQTQAIAKECRIGTNPLIVAIPSTPITMVDMSMSMFSYGMLEVNRLAGRQLPVDGGFDDEGNLTKDPESDRSLT